MCLTLHMSITDWLASKNTNARPAQAAEFDQTEQRERG